MSKSVSPIWKVLVFLLILEISKKVLKYFHIDYPMASTISTFIAAQAFYFIVPLSEFSYRKFTLFIAALLLWHWLIMKVLFELLEPHLPIIPVFLITLSIACSPLAIWWAKTRDKNSQNNNFPG